MKLDVQVILNVKTEQVTKAVTEASRLAMRDTVVAVWNESIHGSPKKTGHNMRSLVGEVSGLGNVVIGADSEPEKSVDDSKIEGAVYGTSGYSGFLEVGTYKMAARPYMKPALDLEFTQEKFTEKVKKHLEA